MTKRLIYSLFAILFISIFSSCSFSSFAQPTETMTPSPTRTLAPTNTKIPSATNTSIPTITLTPMPSATLIPSITPTDIPTSIVLTGTGDKVVDIKKWNGAAIMDITYTGSDNFVVESFDADGNKLELIVNTIGSYKGKDPLDFLDGEATSRFQIIANGNWQITISPFSEDNINSMKVPGDYSGTGDDIVYLIRKPDVGTFACKEEGNFAIWEYTSSTRKLLLNEISPYSGEKIMDNDTILLVVKAPGKWDASITSK